jgi:histone H3/H4
MCEAGVLEDSEDDDVASVDVAAVPDGSPDALDPVVFQRLAREVLQDVSTRAVLCDDRALRVLYDASQDVLVHLLGQAGRRAEAQGRAEVTREDVAAVTPPQLRPRPPPRRSPAPAPPRAAP